MIKINHCTTILWWVLFCSVTVSIKNLLPLTHRHRQAATYILLTLQEHKKEENRENPLMTTTLFSNGVGSNKKVELGRGSCVKWNNIYHLSISPTPIPYIHRYEIWKNGSIKKRETGLLRSIQFQSSMSSSSSSMGSLFYKYWRALLSLWAVKAFILRLLQPMKWTPFNTLLSASQARSQTVKSNKNPSPFF
jgi:hypothetical protein